MGATTTTTMQKERGGEKIINKCGWDLGKQKKKLHNQMKQKGPRKFETI